MTDPDTPPAKRDERPWRGDDNLLLEAVAMTVEQEGWTDRGRMIRRALAELERLQLKVAKARKLHRRTYDTNGEPSYERVTDDYCEHCQTDDEWWPCETIRAMDGDQ